MSRQPGDRSGQRPRPLINGNTAWTLESVLAPPATSNSSSTQQNRVMQSLAGTLGQTPEQVQQAIPLLRDPRVCSNRSRQHKIKSLTCLRHSITSPPSKAPRRIAESSSTFARRSTVLRLQIASSNNSRRGRNMCSSSDSRMTGSRSPRWIWRSTRNRYAELLSF